MSEKIFNFLFNVGEVIELEDMNQIYPNNLYL
jgi:hypothetical protein